MTQPRNPNEYVRMNIVIRGRRTSFSLEVGIWDALRTMCADREVSIDELCEDIVAAAGPGTTMASAVRSAVLEHFMKRCAA